MVRKNVLLPHDWAYTTFLKMFQSHPQTLKVELIRSLMRKKQNANQRFESS